MKITVIKQDGFVSVDGEGYSEIDLSALDSVSMLGSTVRAIQWYETFGDVEFGNSQNQVVANFRIQDFTQFNWILEAFNLRKAEVLAEQARIEAEILAKQTTAEPSPTV
jgi:hypothetical protein